LAIKYRVPHRIRLLLEEYSIVNEELRRENYGGKISSMTIGELEKLH